MDVVHGRPNIKSKVDQRVFEHLCRWLDGMFLVCLYIFVLDNLYTCCLHCVSISFSRHIRV